MTNEKKISLTIDTSKRETVYIALEIDRKKYAEISESRQKKAQALLGLIDRLLKEHSLTVQDVTSITINTGPGSFTGLRVGIAVVNTLGWVLGIPVNGKAGQQVNPEYED